MNEARLSTVADAPAPAGASDRPPFGAKDDIRRERKAPDRNILDRDRIVDAFKQWGIVIVFIALIVIFATLRPTTFPTLQNAVNILNRIETGEAADQFPLACELAGQIASSQIGRASCRERV